MITKTSATRKCSALLAAGAGATVCLTGCGTAHAAFLSGSISASNAGKTVFVAEDHLKAFGSQVEWRLVGAGTNLDFSFMVGQPYLHGTATPASVPFEPLNAGVTINTTLGNWNDHRLAPLGLSNKYAAVRFRVVPTAWFGWLHFVATDAGGASITVDKWGYESTGASCKTLSDSVATQRLGLSDGHIALHWTNANEDGVARYEVQTTNASGAWQAVDSCTPGAGHYAVNVPEDAACRLVVERVDGTSEEVAF